MLRIAIFFAFAPLSLSNGLAQDAGRFSRWVLYDAPSLIAQTDGRTALIGFGTSAALALLSPLDKPLRDSGIQKPGRLIETYTDAMNQLGEPLVAVFTTTGLFGISLLTDDLRFQDAAFTSLQTLAYATAATLALKYTFGRYRPGDAESAFEFASFRGQDAFPSGHATAALAILTPWAMYYPHPASWAILGLAGGGTALARIVKNKHWTTDVLAGSAIGFSMGYVLARRHLDEPVLNMAFRIVPVVTRQGAGLSLTFFPAR